MSETCGREREGDNGYAPSPANLDHIVLPHDLMALIELLAEYNHDTWAAQRIRDGWRFGAARDDVQRTHPCLVPYDQLPDSEKTYDRLSALSSVKLIINLGYIISNDGDTRT